MPLLGIAGHRVLSLLDEFPFVAMNSPIVGYVGAGVRIPKPSPSGNVERALSTPRNQNVQEPAAGTFLEALGVLIARRRSLISPRMRELLS